MPLSDVARALVVALVWGMNFVVIDEGLHGVPPLLFVALRFTAVVLPAVFFVPRPAVPWRVLAEVALFLSIGQFALLYLALAAGMPAGLASIVLQSQVVFTVVLGRLRLRERPTPVQWAGTVVGAVGLVLVGVGRQAHTPLLAVLLIVAAAVSWATGNVASRRAGALAARTTAAPGAGGRAGAASGLSMTVWTGVFVPVPMLVLSLLVDGPGEVVQALGRLDAVNVASTLYTAYLASLVGYGTWNALLARHRVADVVPFTLLVPVVGIATAWLVQGERPGAAEAAGALVLLAGVALVALCGPRRTPTPGPGPTAADVRPVTPAPTR